MPSSFHQQQQYQQQRHRPAASVLWVAVLVGAACCAQLAAGHGLLTKPASRNVDDSCGYCLNAGGQWTVHADGGYLHGMCGNNAGDADQNWNAASDSPQLIGTSGDSFEVQVAVTAHHLGFFEFELCDSPNISEACFRSRRLYRTGCDPAQEGEAVCRRWWKVLNSNEFNHYSLQPQGYPDGAPYTTANSCDSVLYTGLYDIPDNVSCTHCVLRWHWHTSNDCTSPDSNSEEYWNCADVRINAPDGADTVDTSPADLVALNAVLTTTLPEDLSGVQTDDDYWACPQPAYGRPGEYSCSLNGTIEDTSGCVAYTEGETCVVERYDGELPTTATSEQATSTAATTASVDASTTSAATGYCAWMTCTGFTGVGWCDADRLNCEGPCSGVWCSGNADDVASSASTTAQDTSTAPASANGWHTGLNATHFWDCNGAACDATTLSPWDETEYKYSAQYAPVDPADHGGAQYGETMWTTGSASDALSQLLGANDGCCGADDSGVGGCGKCVLVRNPLAVNSNWTAVVMKKNRCPPWSTGCEEGKVHLDIAAPGFDNLEYSTANICGSDQRTNTYLTEHESSMCGNWSDAASSADVGCDCSAMRSDTPELAMLKRGCELFASWGWTSRSPQLEYTTVACPTAFVNLIEGAFSSDGVQDVAEENQTTSKPATTLATEATATEVAAVTLNQTDSTTRTDTMPFSLSEGHSSTQAETITTVSSGVASQVSDAHAATTVLPGVTFQVSDTHAATTVFAVTSQESDTHAATTVSAGVTSQERATDAATTVMPGITSQESDTHAATTMSSGVKSQEGETSADAIAALSAKVDLLTELVDLLERSECMPADR